MRQLAYQINQHRCCKAHCFCAGFCATQCLMNGSNHLEEAISRPFTTCPVCLRKVHDSMRAVGMDLGVRERLIGAFFREYGMDKDAAASDQRLMIMAEEVPPLLDAPLPWEK